MSRPPVTRVPLAHLPVTRPPVKVIFHTIQALNLDFVPQSALLGHIFMTILIPVHVHRFFSG